MKKVLIFGSSHIGAIKNGLELYKLDRTPSLDFSFLGFSQPRFKRSFVVKDGAIRATKQKVSRKVKRLFCHRKVVHLSSFDAVIYFDGPCLLDLSLYCPTDSVRPLSRELVKTIILNGALGSYFRQLQGCCSPNQLYYLGKPLRAETPVLSIEHGEHDRTEKLLSERRILSSLQTAVQDVCDRSLKDESQPTYLIPPPVLLDQTGFLTRREFMSEGVRFDGKTRDLKDRDVSHANAEYGKIIIEHLEKLLG